MFNSRFNPSLLRPLFLLSVFLIVLFKVEDPDTWQHLSFGRLIWELKGLPVTEPFQYTMIDQPFFYTSWLFALTYYLAYLTFDIYGVVLLKAATVTAACYIIFRDSMRPYENNIITIIVMTAVVIVSRHRFVERPDTFLMVFLPFTIFSLNAFVYENKKYIYILPLIHLLWANSHSSINLMLIPFFSFVAGGFLQQYLNKKGMRFSNTPSASQLKLILTIFAISFAVSLLNPNFIEQYTWGAKVLATPWFKQEIIEAFAPTWRTDKWPYIIAVAVAGSFILNWLVAYRSRNKESAPFIHFIMVIPFIILAFTAVRFIFLLAFIAGPVLTRNISALLKGSKIFETRAATAASLLWIVLYTTLIIANVGPFGNKGTVFGLGVNYDVIPENALRYMDRRDITGRVFNIFQWGQYIAWRDFPKRAPFIDARGYAPLELLEKMDLAKREDSVLNELYSRYGFESVLVNYPNLDTDMPESEVDLALSSPEWALVYWDDLSLVYLKRGGRYDSTIKEDEYRFVKPANGIYKSRLYDIKYRSNLIRELKRNIEETGSSKAYAFLGFIYNEAGLHREAIESYSKVRDFQKQSHIVTAYSGMAYANNKLGHLDESINYYKKALSIGGAGVNEEANILYNLGTVYLSKGDKKAALKCFNKALVLNKDFIYVYPLLIAIYSNLREEDNVRRFSRMYEEAKSKNIGEKHFKSGVEAYLKQQYDIAVEEFKKSIEAIPSNAEAYSNLGYVYFDMDMVNDAFEYQKKAIDINPNLASAHYGLALIYKKRGEMVMARGHFMEYLRIEPSGYFSRRAKEEIGAIK